MNTFKKNILLFAILGFVSCNVQKKYIQIDDEKIESKLIISEEFDTNMEEWTVEQRPGGSVKVLNQQLDIDDASGCTVWFNQKLKAPLMIEYDAVVIDKGGKNDRVSDLNCFWMANDIDYPDNIFTNSTERGGKFQNYHNMKLYYVGLGGHNNTKTRFRKYAGGGDRPCLPEHDFSNTAYMITANQLNHIKLIVYKNHVQYYRNGQLIYDFTDNKPYTDGYFGIRTFNNHMRVDNFKVYQLVD